MGDFVALGQQIHLEKIRIPLFMLAAMADELATHQQLFAVENLVSTAPQNLGKTLVPCRHVGLFMGKRTLEDEWPHIVSWLKKAAVSQCQPGRDADGSADTLIGSLFNTN